MGSRWRGEARSSPTTGLLTFVLPLRVSLEDIRYNIRIPATLVSRTTWEPTLASEIEAMSQIEKALAGLEPDEVQRVVVWMVDYANKRLGAEVARPSGTRRGPGGAARDGDQPSHSYERIGDLIDAAEPSSGVEYALVATYWFQELQGNENVTGQQVNDQLKDLGHGIPNITDAFNSLQGRRPAFARQVEKSGTSRQARKRYRLTQAGVRRVEQMLTAGNGEE